MWRKTWTPSYILFLILACGPLSGSMKAEEPTCIDRQYYLRGVASSGQMYSGTGYDLGTISSAPPQETGERNCASWIQFSFRPAGFFPNGAVQTIRKIYYHIWWSTFTGEGLLGYDSSGSVSSFMDESFDASASVIASADGYFLTAFEQEISPAFGSFSGDEIFNLTIKLRADGRNPSIISSPSFPSFIIVNPNSLENLNALDSDSDGISDCDEMYFAFTDPQKNDTDSDGYCDYTEVISNPAMRPNDPQDAPVFGRHVLVESHGEWTTTKQGTAAVRLSETGPEGFRRYAIGESGIRRVLISNYDLSIHAILSSPVSQQDGFGEAIVELQGPSSDDRRLVVGAPYDGEGNGKVYFYQSNSTLVDTIAAPVAERNFGASLASVNDQDADGFQDLAIAAPGMEGAAHTGRVYLFSGRSLELIREYEGEFPGDRFGFSILSVPDQDGDGRAELVIGAPYDSTTGYHAGCCRLFSSSGESLNAWYGQTRDLLGFCIVQLDDYDQGGFADIAVSAPGDSGLIDRFDASIEPAGGRIRIFSTENYVLLKTLSAGSMQDGLGIGMASFPDLDADGRDEIVALTRRGRFQKKSIVLISSKNNLIFRRYFNFTEPFGPADLILGEDFDWDGRPEALVCSPKAGFNQTLGSNGAIHIVSTKGEISERIFNSAGFDPSDYFIDPDGGQLQYEIVGMDEAGEDKICAERATNDDQKLIIVAKDEYGQTCSSNIIILPGLSPTPMPTATIEPGNYKTKLVMPSSEFRTGDLFWLIAELDTGKFAQETVFFAVILEISGQYWFWDDWTTVFDYVPITTEPGINPLPIIAALEWPDMSSDVECEATFWGAMLKEDLSGILGGEEGMGRIDFKFGC